MDFDRNFWWDEGANPSKCIENVSSVCKKSYQQVFSWYLRNQDFIVKIKEKITGQKIADFEDEEDDGDSDEEDDQEL